MTGILEQMFAMHQQMSAELQSIKALLANGHAPAPATAIPPAQPPAAAFDPLAGFGTQPAALPPPAQPQVTEDQIMELINPHLGNPTVKQAMSAELQAMGIPRLSETQPHQMLELYQRLHRVIQMHGATAGAPAVSPAPASPVTSII